MVGTHRTHHAPGVRSDRLSQLLGHEEPRDSGQNLGQIRKTFVQGLAISSATCPPIENNVSWLTDILLWVAVAFTL